MRGYIKYTKKDSRFNQFFEDINMEYARDPVRFHKKYGDRPIPQIAESEYLKYNPEEALAEFKEERVAIYKDPANDPLYQELQDRINKRAGSDKRWLKLVKDKGINNKATQKESTEAYRRARALEAERFAFLYPLKAKKYASTDPELAQVVKNIEKRGVNYYAALGVSKDATFDEIQRAYRDSKIESDAINANTQQFSAEEKISFGIQEQEIDKAYEVLSDPELRKEFDSYLASASAQETSAAEFAYATRPYTVGVASPGIPPVEEVFSVQKPYPGFNPPGIQEVHPEKEAGPSITGQLGSTLVQKGVGKAASSLGAKTAAEAVAVRAAGATAAKVGLNAIPVVGNVLSAAATVLPLAKRYWKELSAVPLALAALISGLIALLLGAVVAAFGLIILAAFLVIFGVPALIALIIFITNTGAYVMPPYGGGSGNITPPGTITSPYINITKTAQPAGPFLNDRLFVPPYPEITYTITITATRTTIRNITFNYSCSIINRSNTNPPCPDPQNVQVNGQAVASINAITPPVEIQQNTPYVITYTVSYTGSNYVDSLVTDMFSVSSDNPDNPSERTTAATSASVIFGNPPTSCFVFDSTWDTNFQSTEAKARMQQQIAYLVQHHPNYTAKICQAGTTTISYGVLDPSGNQYYGFCPRNPGNRCTFYNTLFANNDTYLYYTLTHELAHRLNWVRPDLFDLFVQIVHCQNGETNCESFLPGYRWGSSTGEDFAETEAWYAEGLRWTTLTPYSNMSSAYPIHYNFARACIYEEGGVCTAP